MVILGDFHAAAPAMVQLAGQTKPTSEAEKMWKPETRKRKVTSRPGTDEWLDTRTLVREDGLSLMLVGIGREHQFDFIYSENEESFTFTATRYLGETMTDTWLVLLGGALNRLEYETGKPVSFVRAREVADNIKDGLLAWPWYGDAEKTPAKGVRYHVTPWRHWSPALDWGE